MAKRNIVLFIAYSAVICACLALMKDFGTAIIFFVAFLVIAFLRSGNFATIALAIAATGFAGVLVLRFYPTRETGLRRGAMCGTMRSRPGIPRRAR